MLVLQQQQQLQHQLFEQHQQQQQQQNGMGDGNSSDLDDLHRLRERMSQTTGRGDRGRRRGSRSSSAVTVSESDLAARKELIHQNLFTRQINREESVMELSLLLAISRGGGSDGNVNIMEEEDIELGRRSGIASKEPSSKSERKLREENDDEEANNTTPYTEMNVPTLPPNVPAPSAPPMPTIEVTPGAETTTSTATTKATAAISRIWRSLSQRQQSDTTIILDTSPQQAQQPHQQANTNNNDMGSTRTIHNSVSLSSSSLRHPNKIECSICLEQYSPNDIIAWAKDGGGDAPLPSTSSGNAASSYNTGCDHIFHRECLVAWLLQDHDECPLCRRRVIHADAHVRFAGWDER
jgi:hypothetical protein